MDDDYYQMAVVFWYAILESQTRKEHGQNKLKFKKKAIISLLYYRLRDLKYNPMKDDNIIRKMKEYGFEI